MSKYLGGKDVGVMESATAEGGRCRAGLEAALNNRNDRTPQAPDAASRPDGRALSTTSASHTPQYFYRLGDVLTVVVAALSRVRLIVEVSPYC